MNINELFPGTLVHTVLQEINLGKEPLDQRYMNVQF